MIISHTNDLHSEIYQDALAIRKTVFIDEQHVPAELEVDEHEADAIYFVAYDEDQQQPLGTARILIQPTENIIQRVAVLKTARGKHVGQRLMNAIIEYAKQHHIQTLTLGAQDHAIDFYRKLGFEISDPTPYQDAGISHFHMHLNLENI